MKHLTRADIEYTLRRNDFHMTVGNLWIRSYDLGWGEQNRTFKVGNKYIVCDRFTTLVLADLTPERWERATRLKFHRREK